MQLLPPCFQLTRDENDLKSALYTEGTNTKNSYVVKAALRNRTSIHEATSETLSAVNIQVAFWISMSTTIRETNAVFKSAFDIDVTNLEYGLKADRFSDFSNSAIRVSLIAGFISLTFAQYKKYMTRHAQDTEAMGKVVYFFACAFNSLAVLLSQIAYYTAGLPFFTITLINIIRTIVDLGPLDDNPSTVSEMMSVLLLVTVLLPLKFLPIFFEKLMNFCTDKWILHKAYHLKKRNRSGYETGNERDSTQHMFLPSSSNKYDHISQEDVSPNPGFHYFSRDPLSRKLYQLKFEIALFSKVVMHLFYLSVTLLLSNTFHFVVEKSTIKKTFWMESMNTESVHILGEKLFRCASIS